MPRGSEAGTRWSAPALVLIAAAIVAVLAALRIWGDPLMLRFGPPEFAAVLIFELAVAISLARASHLRAVAMAAVGFILSVVGLDTITGETRLTVGIEALVDGIDWLVLALALFVVADAAICLYAPEKFLAYYARQVRGWSAPPVAPWARLAMRVVAVAAIGGAIWYAFALSHRVADVMLLFLLAAFGVACRVFDWNRLVLLLAFSVGVMLEENIRRSMLVSQGDPEIFFRPISLGILVAACVVLAAAAFLRFRRS